MNLKKIKELIQLVKEEGVAELRIENESEKYCIKMPYGVSLSQNDSIQMQNSSLEGVQSNVELSELVEIKSPFVGTFYRSSSPESDAYVSPGQKISSGQVLCIIEAMKIMNEIESEVSGEIVEICVGNETYVEYGQTLFKVRQL